MDNKEGLTITAEVTMMAPEQETPTSEQTLLTLAHIDKKLNEPLISQPISVADSQDVNGNKTSSNFVMSATGCNIQGNMMPFPSLASTEVCIDNRLLDAARDGMTDKVLQLIEEEGQQLHAYRDKVRY